MTCESWLHPPVWFLYSSCTSLQRNLILITELLCISRWVIVIRKSIVAPAHNSVIHPSCASRPSRPFFFLFSPLGMIWLSVTLSLSVSLQSPFPPYLFPHHFQPLTLATFGELMHIYYAHWWLETSYVQNCYSSFQDSNKEERNSKDIACRSVY